MTIATTVNKVTGQGNGATTAFSFSFLMPAAANAVATFVDAFGVQTVLQQTQYSISGIGNPNGGTINYPLAGPPMSAGQSVTLQRVLPYQQLTSLVNQSGYYPAVVETALDNIEMQIQQIAASTGGNTSLQFPAVDPITLNATLPAAAARANNLLSFDSLGNVVAVAPAAQSATALSASLIASAGSTLIGWIQTGIGAVTRLLTAKLRESLSVQDYGAVGDGVTDDTAAFNAAHTAAALLNKSVFVPATAAGYKIAGTVAVKTSMYGEGFGSILATSSATADIFQVAVQGVTIADVAITASVTRTAGYFVNFNSGVANANNYSRIERCLLTQWFSGIGYTGAGSTTLHIFDCVMTTSIVGGIGITEASTANAVDVVIRDTFIVGPSSGSQCAAGVQVQNVGDLTISRLSTVKTGVGLNLIPQNGQTVQAVFSTDCEFDSGSGCGVQMNPATGGSIQLAKFVNTWACTNTHGFLLNPSATGTTRRVEIINATASNNAGGHGIFHGGATVQSLLISGGSASQNLNGVTISAGATDFRIEGGRYGPTGQFAANTSAGISLSAGATDNFTIQGNDCRGNTVSSISDGASGVSRVITDNLGFVTKNSGSSNVAIGTALTTVTHGLVSTPNPQDIQIIETASRTVSGVTAVWISAIGATTFQVNTNVNVATAALTFGWKATCKGA